MKTTGTASGWAVLATGVVLLATGPASGVIALTTWDSGTAEGWTWQANAYGRWDVLFSGGNPGGYIRFHDLDQTHVADDLHASSAYLGNYSGLDGSGWFEFDMRADTAAAIGPWMYLSGPGGVASYQAPKPGTTWSRYTVPISAATWNVSSGTWSGLLANITDIHIVGDISSGYNHPELALDNFALLPEPATLVLLLAGAALPRRRDPVRRAR